MTTKSTFCALLLALPLAAVAASNQSYLLVETSAVRQADERMVFAGSLSVISNGPSPGMNISADEIIFEQRNGKSLLKCTGEVVIESNGTTTKTRDFTIVLDDMSGNVYILNPNGIVMGRTATVDTGGYYASSHAPSLANHTARFEPQPTLFLSPASNGIAPGAAPLGNVKNFEFWTKKIEPEPLPAFDNRPGSLLPRR